MLNRRILLAFLLCLAGPVAAQPPAPPVVASFSILGDFVREVGGEGIELSTIVGPNGDAHVYEPTPGDGRKLAAARLVFVNGLGFEGWIDRLIAASKTKAKIVTVSAGVAPRHNEEGLDPHAWQDVANAKRYVENIRDALVKADPSRAKMFEANAAAYLAKLDGLDREVVAALNAIPAERRRIVSTHDAFGYFSARYGLKFIAPQGVSTQAEASARDIARIIELGEARKSRRGVLGEHRRSAPRPKHRRANRRQGRRHALFRRAVGCEGPGAHLYRDGPA